MRFLLLLCSLILTACVTQQHEDNYSPYLSTFIGKSEADVLRVFGAPEKVYSADGVKVVSFNTDQGLAGTSMYGVWVSQKRYCQTSFVIEKVVKSFKWDGNLCVGPIDKAKQEADAAEIKKKSESDSIVNKTDSFH